MEAITEGTPACAALLRRADGLFDIQGHLRRLDTLVVSVVMYPEAE